MNNMSILSKELHNLAQQLAQQQHAPNYAQHLAQMAYQQIVADADILFLKNALQLKESYFTLLTEQQDIQRLKPWEIAEYQDFEWRFYDECIQLCQEYNLQPDFFKRATTGTIQQKIKAKYELLGEYLQHRYYFLRDIVNYLSLPEHFEPYLSFIDVQNQDERKLAKLLIGGGFDQVIVNHQISRLLPLFPHDKSSLSTKRGAKIKPEIAIEQSAEPSHQPIIADIPTIEPVSKKSKSSLTQKVGKQDIFIAVFVVIFGLYFACSSPSKQATTAESYFSAWDGSNYELVQAVKKQMKDPSSFEHVETKFTDHGNNIRIMMTYRGKNSFGAVVIQQVTANFDKQTRTISEVTFL